MTNRRDGVLARAFLVLSTFGDGRRNQTLSELSRLTGLPVNTTLRIARSLMDEGALERDSAGRFSIGLRMFELSSLTPRIMDVRQVALPFLADLRDLTGQHALLTVREDDEAVLVERLSKRGATAVRYRIGGRLPLDATGGGLALLAFAPHEVRERAIDRFQPRVIDRLGSAADLRRMLAEIRAAQSVVATQAAGEGLESVAVPIIVSGDQPTAAISVILPRDDDPARFIPALSACARAIARQLVQGFRPMEFAQSIE